MLDTLSAPAAPAIIRRENYAVPDWLIPEIKLDFDLDAARTSVSSILSVTRNGAHDRPLVLDWDGTGDILVAVDGKPAADWSVADGKLSIALRDTKHVVALTVTIAPEHNTQLMGLYASGGLLCTQCEAEGFRRITPFPDRPDVLSRYAVHMAADKVLYPILLSNGDCTGSGELPGGRHWAAWTDPFPKPCYLFALVAGDLTANRDIFITMSGKTVDLAIWVAEADLPKTAHAMQALKDSMAWDEQVYGREYDLGQFNIVAVADFNFGAMENKSLNVFNSRYVLADAETATDFDYDNVAGVVAHEYFHNWSGNRITCRDWFQLSLKEGFTVFRDQCFSADHGSPAVKRIEDVRALRAAQFPEDSGPLAHPVRPESYIEIANFYTSTIYNKGAEVIRMMHSLVGAERFRTGTDLYFERHDGEAATCENFIACIEEGAGIDLAQFRLWYAHAGTPRIAARVTHDAASGTAQLTLTQHIPDTPGQTGKAPMMIPLRFALYDRATGSHKGEELHVMTGATSTLRFSGFTQAPVLSINRGFAAPVIIDADRSAADLAFLSAHDDDSFGRYEAMQQLMLDTLVAAASGNDVDHAPVIEAVRRTLENNALEAALIGEAVLLPSEAFIGDQMLVVDPDAIRAAREALRTELGSILEGQWRSAYAAHSGGPFEVSPAAKGSRRLRTVALGYIMASGAADAGAMALAQFNTADNMTDRQGAMQTLVNSKAPERTQALDAFYARHKADALVIDKWFSVQAASSQPDTPDAVATLRNHADFTLSNPNRVRALIGAFGGNQAAFHVASGAGYTLLADVIIALDPLNPQTAAKMITPLGRWKRFGAARQALMQAALHRILATPGLSKDVFEQASKSLG